MNGRRFTALLRVDRYAVGNLRENYEAYRYSDVRMSALGLFIFFDFLSEV